MLQKVKRPDGKEVSFEYDALGRRIAKIANKKITRYIWDGNVLLHEWSYDIEEEPKTFVDDEGNVVIEKERVENLVTWVYGGNGFTPVAKLINGKKYSVVSDYLGTPIQAYNNSGEKVWEREFDSYGNTRYGDNFFIPFLYQGQYFDGDVDLFYNRFRYYDAESGSYISKDPIGLLGGFGLYNYVRDVSKFIDPFGLSPWGDVGISFKDWFDNFATPDQIRANKEPIKDILRGNGGKHEMFPVSMADKAKSLGFTYDELMDMTMDREKVWFEGVPDKYGNTHSGPHSTGMPLPDGQSGKASSWFHKKLSAELEGATTKSQAKRIIKKLHNKYVNYK